MYNIIGILLLRYIIYFSDGSCATLSVIYITMVVFKRGNDLNILKFIETEFIEIHGMASCKLEAHSP